MLCIKNGMIHDMVNPEAYEGDILMDGGKITAIGKNLDIPEGTEVYDACGKDVYPGFVDAHSHLGLDGYGIGFEGQDYNERNDICTPQLRGIDSFNPMDPSVSMAAKGGVTCVGTGPGSSNVIGGTFFAAKTAGHCVDDMIVKNPIAMKCAFGENPKRCYKDVNNYARMSTASKLREMLFKTRDYMARKAAAGDDPLKKPAFDMKLEAMIPVLEKKIPLKAHAHQANDILTAIRIAKEFDIDMTLEHCTEGHLIVDEMVKAGFPCAVGPSFGHASKVELQNKTWETPGILAAAGCQVSIITDAPVTPQQYLPICAGFAVKAGMDPYEALKAITINPAKHLGVADRVGSLEVGKDGDVVVYDGSPFEISSQLKLVVINGERIK
ncbi:MAG TPA: amidohydrolase [Candidatus Lachnoclostridium stercoripullorum]|uniref:Amidohydrolase n=1 Tax=Candidatus Lachnoclostridium stercoripullorum TaxID=2838635 RepID=A0A9D2AWB1_9FIRM|nr:amidohydrolase [Candidatus Lachnoclostridium stercoripullorum]